MRTSNLIKCGKSVKQKNCIQRLMLEVFFFFITYMIDCICRYQITEPLDYVTGGCFSKQIKAAFRHNLRRTSTKTFALY